MAANPLRSSSGFTYLMALIVVVIMGIMLAAAGQSWKTVMDREREEELLFRGMQYRDAITRWYKPRPGERPPPPLNDLKDLLRDPNTIATVRYLRTLYNDPLTGEDWVPIKAPGKGIIGVASSSEQKPIKQANFPKGLELLEEKDKYSEWQFVFEEGTTLSGQEQPFQGPTRQPVQGSVP
jgi:type II secretory pathway pseudopilin PulG